VTDTSQGSQPQLVRLGETPPLPDYLRSLWRRREFALSIAQGELRSQHVDTTLGAVWHLLNPILLTAVYGLVFGLLLAGNRPENFLVFLSIGVFTYSYSQRAITSGGNAIANNIGLIRSLQFPRAVLPMASVARETIAFGWSALVLVALLLLTGAFPTWRWLLAVPAFVLQVVFSIGAALFVARLTDSTRDISNVLPFVFRLGFYASGVLFPVDRFIEDERLLNLFLLNPLFVYLSLIRYALLEDAGITNIAGLWISALVWTPAALLLGLVYFRAGEKSYGRG
jgi:teichoic acid transport system permease protein